jgi:hypothetical protein
LSGPWANDRVHEGSYVDTTTSATFPGASVAKVVLARGINSNIVFAWRKLAHGLGPPWTR